MCERALPESKPPRGRMLVHPLLKGVADGLARVLGELPGASQEATRPLCSFAKLDLLLAPTLLPEPLPEPGIH